MYLLHTLIIAHAVVGFVSLFSAVVALRRGRLHDLHVWMLIGTIVFLAVVGTIGWPDRDTGGHLLDIAFVGLGIFMIVRAVLAGRIRPCRGARPSQRYADLIGFNVIALSDAFAVIVVLDAGAPVVAVVGTGVVIAFLGHLALQALKRRLSAHDRMTASTG